NSGSLFIAPSWLCRTSVAFKDSSQWRTQGCPYSDRPTSDRETMLCPLYPQKRTCAVQKEISALGQKRTSCSSTTSLVSVKQTAGLAPRPVARTAPPPPSGRWRKVVY